MKRLFYFSLSASILFFSSCSSSRQNTGPLQLKILTYNIHHANPPSKPEFIDLEAILVLDPEHAEARSLMTHATALPGKVRSHRRCGAQFDITSYHLLSVRHAGDGDSTRITRLLY